VATGQRRYISYSYRPHWRPDGTTGRKSCQSGCTSLISNIISTYNGCGLIVQSGQVSGVTCKGRADGSLAVTASGGTEPYRYIWSNSQNTPALTGLAAGIYTVSVTDANSCESSIQVQITEPPGVCYRQHPCETNILFRWQQRSGRNICIGRNRSVCLQLEYRTDDQPHQFTEYRDLHGNSDRCQRLQYRIATTAIAAPTRPESGLFGRCAGALHGRMRGRGHRFGLRRRFTPYNLTWNTPGRPAGTTSAVNLCPGTCAITATDAQRTHRNRISSD
jgi:hypothetical protein